MELFIPLMYNFSFRVDRPMLLIISEEVYFMQKLNTTASHSFLRWMHWSVDSQSFNSFTISRFQRYHFWQYPLLLMSTNTQKVYIQLGACEYMWVWYIQRTRGECRLHLVYTTCTKDRFASWMHGHALVLCLWKFATSTTCSWKCRKHFWNERAFKNIFIYFSAHILHLSLSFSHCYFSVLLWTDHNCVWIVVYVTSYIFVCVSICM